MTEPLILYRWCITDEVTGKRRRTTYLMTEKDAQARHPGAEPDLASREIRDSVGRAGELGNYSPPRKPL